jgi:hypothetical protein
MVASPAVAKFFSMMLRFLLTMKFKELIYAINKLVLFFNLLICSPEPLLGQCSTTHVYAGEKLILKE